MSTPTNAAIVDLKGRKWQPFESKTAAGHVSYDETAGEIHIPYGTDDVSMTIQAHELSHIRYSAKVWPQLKSALARLTSLAGTSAAIVGYAEDMRITALASRLNVKTLPDMNGNDTDRKIVADWIASFVEAGIPEEHARKAAQFILTQHTSVVATIGLSLDTLQRKDSAERYIAHCARHIHKLLSEDKSESDSDKSKSDGKSDKGESSDKPESEDTGSDTGKGQKSDDSDASSDTKAASSESDGSSEASADSDTHADGGIPTIDVTHMTLPDIREAMVSSVPAPVDTAKLIQTFQHTLNTADWIPVTKIDRMPLVRRAAQARSRGRKLSETGVALGSAYDAVAPNERRPFTAQRKGGAGGLTVLIDCSGSMRIAASQLEALLLKHPTGVVVTYASNLTKALPEQQAVVRVIASHGRLAATEDFRELLAGANGCDGPVLEWLAKQSGERVWICDGVITGKRDRIVDYDTPARDAWLKAHRITRYRSLTEYVGKLTKG